MIFQVLKSNRLARITAIITTFTILVCIIVGFMIMRLTNKIQETKLNIKQNSLNAQKIEQLLSQYQEVESLEKQENIEKKSEINSETKIILEKKNIVDLIELMEHLTQKNKVVAQLQIEGGNDLGKLSNEIVYNIHFIAKEANMLAYLNDLENLPYVSTITQFYSNFSIDNNELKKLETEDEIDNAIISKRKDGNQTYSIRLKIMLQ